MNSRYLPFIGRVLIGLPFAMSGLSKLAAYGPTTEMIAAQIASGSARLQGLGLGWLIYDARNFSRANDMIVGMITIGLLGKASDKLMALAQTLLLRWRQAFQGV